MALGLGVVFDLDDTLYLEREYVQSGFKYIAQMLAEITGIADGELFDYMWRLFEEGHRGHTFNRLFETYPEIAQKVKIEDLVDAYRKHTPDIKPLTGAMELVYNLRYEGCQLGLISDGPLESQQAKVDALGIGHLFEPLVLTDIWGRDFWKPNPKGYETISEAWDIKPGELVYIGDNPKKDFVTPRRLGWQTIRLRVEGQLRFSSEPPSPEYAADEEAYSYEEIRDMLRVRL